jgi:FHS family L-fucose permease-like MFS transporter
MTTKNNSSALTTLVTVFFFWGFIGASNGVFIPFCKEYFLIDQFQSQLVDFAFYGAYYVGALILFILSSQRKKDIFNSWGYKKRNYLWVININSWCISDVSSYKWS